MKKILMAMLLTVMVCLQGPAEAAPSNTWQDDSFDLSSIHRFYVNPYMMNYTASATSPQVADIEASFMEIGLANKYFVIGDADMQRFLQRDQQLDLTGKTNKEAAAAIEPYLGQYTDAYVIMTIVHNNRVVIFYDVFAAKTGKKVYSYQVIAGTTDEDNIKTYSNMTKKFFREFNHDVKEQSKKKK